MTDPIAVAKTLEQAVDVIDELGWCQGMFRSPEGQVCVTRAVTLAAGLKTNSGAHHALQAHVRDVALTNWNDAPGRTEAEVTQALRDAAMAVRDGRIVP